MREIELTQGQVAIVDDADYDRLAQHNWYALKTRCGFYAARSYRRKGEKHSKTLLMHRVILRLRSRHRIADHEDHNGLNNVRTNIRACSPSQSMANRHDKRKLFKGFIFNKKNGNYNARIVVRGKLIHLGVFAKPEDAARQYDVAAKKYYGRFALLNFPEAA